ncbi:hypothetical protein BLOT_014622 [Blomia tropicalis]|nr:hypothetical protein BLOT_014622 [Blomia tropicalis]
MYSITRTVFVGVISFEIGKLCQLLTIVRFTTTRNRLVTTVTKYNGYKYKIEDIKNHEIK